MKKILIVFSIIIGLTNCQLVDVLEQDPMYELDLENAITSPEMAELALTGTYGCLPAKSTNYTFATLSGSFMSGALLRQNFITSGVSIYYSENYLPTLSYSTFGDEEWGCDYEVIKNVNYLLQALEKLDDSEFKAGRKAEIIGECHFLTALSYFRLLRQFSEFWDENSNYGILIRDEIPSVSNAVKVRATVAQSYEEIYKHLEIALNQAPEYTTSTQASVQAAKALKAVVLFYQGKYSEAAVAADEAITSTNPLDPSYSNVFTNAETSKEVIFCRAFGTDDVSDVSYFMEKAFGATGIWGPTESYMNLIEGDPRKDLVTENKDVVYNGVTYNVNTVKKLYIPGEGVPVIFLRTAELYLIKAEALARSNASIADAWAPIKELRNRVGADMTEPASRDELMDEIFKEWWIEMAFENWHEWFATRRFDRLLEMNKSLAEQLEDEQEKDKEDEDGGNSFEQAFLQKLEWRKIYNIPTSEINANSACEQNPGY